VSYNGEDTTFSSTAVLGMLLTKCKQIVALNNPGVTSVDAVLSVPTYYTEAQRRAVKDAAAIAGLNCLRLQNEGTAAALSYGIFKGAKKEFPEGAETRVLFLDMGASQFTATVAAFTNSSLKVLASACDSELGSRDLDVAIAKFFVAEFKAKTGLDAWKSKKARVKLMMAAEKAKVSISPHGVNHTPVSVECLMEDRDFSGALTADKLDELVGATVSARVGAVIARALASAGLKDYKDFATIELVGGGMRPRLVKRAAAVALGMPLDEATGHGLSQSMNLDEAVARGCGLQCAMLSPVFKVKPFDITDTVPYPVRVAWEAPSGADAAAGSADGGMDVDEEGGGAAGAAPAAAAAAAGADAMDIFKAGDVSPLTRRVTFKRSQAFTITAENVFGPELAAMAPAGVAPLLGRYTVTGFPAGAEAAAPGGVKVRVDFRHDADGLFSVPSAELLKEIKEEGEAEAAAGEAGAAPKKKRFRRVDLKVEGGSAYGMEAAALRAAVEAELRMIATDAEIRATQDMRNSLEACIYNMRGALEDALRPFSTDGEREGLQAALSDMESWLYGEGFEADKKTYAAKLKALEARGAPISLRKVESEARYGAGQALLATVEDFRGIVANRTGRHAHLSDADRDVMRAACAEVETWFRGKQEEQGKLEMWQDPVLKVSDMSAARDRLVKELAPIANRPPPAPATAPAPAAAPAAAAAPPAAEGDVPMEGATPKADMEVEAPTA
jgi:heat shock protein 4